MPPSLICTRCGKSWDSTLTERMREFTTPTTYPRNVYASPSEVSASGEDLIFCPSCFIEDRDRGLGDFSLFLKDSDERVDPDNLDKERGSKGDADVAHTPSLEGE